MMGGWRWKPSRSLMRNIGTLDVSFQGPDLAEAVRLGVVDRAA